MITTKTRIESTLAWGFDVPASCRLRGVGVRAAAGGDVPGTSGWSPPTC